LRYHDHSINHEKIHFAVIRHCLCRVRLGSFLCAGAGSCTGYGASAADRPRHGSPQ
jgi:hypothetical protein